MNSPRKLRVSHSRCCTRPIYSILSSRAGHRNTAREPKLDITYNKTAVVMEPNFRFIVAIVFIFAKASGAPTGDRVEDACISVKSSSSQLNEIARNLSVEVSLS